MKQKSIALRYLIFLLPMLLLILPNNCYCVSLPGAMREAVKEIKQSKKIPEGSNVIISGITSYYTKKKDELSKRIETDLFFAFEKQFPGVRLVDINESLTGVSSGNSIFIKGNYRKTGNKGTLYLKAFKGTMDGEVVYQAVVEFDTEFRRKTLVAVLDIEAKFLNSDQRRIFSDVFREALGESKTFDMASSADVDRMNPDELKKATGCSQDSCATLIGKQLGVDRVVSTSLRRLNKKTYYFSGKIMDIQDGSIVSAKTVKHTGGVDSFDVSLVALANKLTADLDQAPAPTPVKAKIQTITAKPDENDLYVYDENTGLYWQKAEAGTNTWSKALEYCRKLDLAGRTDWRLPDNKELESSYQINDKFPDLVDNYYWTSTTNKDYKDYAWGMTASSGDMFDDGSKTSKYNVRCVSGVKEPEKLYVVDKITGLYWQKYEGGEQFWKKAVEYCKDLDLEGERDWRLPSKDELITTNRFKEQFPDLVSGYYWTSTTNNEYPDYAWGMESSAGDIFDNGHKESKYNVRCVKGEIDSATLTLEDEETGLIWQRGESGAHSWSDAILYCQNLKLAGQSDWRLPDKNELESSFAIQDQFPGLVNSYYWSSTESEGLMPWAWGMTISTGGMFNNGIKYKSYNVRCVRGLMK